MYLKNIRQMCWANSTSSTLFRHKTIAFIFVQKGNNLHCNPSETKPIFTLNIHEYNFKLPQKTCIFFYNREFLLPDVVTHISTFIIVPFVHYSYILKLNKQKVSGFFFLHEIQHHSELRGKNAKKQSHKLSGRVGVDPWRPTTAHTQTRCLHQSL